MTIERDGRISATTGASPHGQGNETTFAQMLADQFGVPIEHITILHGDTGVVKQGIGTFGSRSQAVGGTALHLAGAKVKTKMAKFAAALLEAHEDDLVFENGTISVKGSPASGKSFASVAAYAYVPVPLPEGLEPGLSDEAFFEPGNNTYPFGCHISMLEIDRQTGEPTLLKLVAVDDCGNLINPLIVEGQIHGGLAQGIGQAMIEEVVYNEDGQLMTGSFMDYAIPRAIDFPRFELAATVTPTPVNPLGAKGVGEAGTLGSTPCIVAAAVDALSEFGVKHIDMMLRPEKLWRIIQGGGDRDLDGIRVQPGHVAGRCAREASRDQRRRQVHRRRPQSGPADEAAPERTQDADRHRPHSGPVRDPQEGRHDRNRRRHRPPRRGDVRRYCSRRVRCWPRPRRRSAIRRSAIAARSAAAWPTPIPPPTTRRRCWRSTPTIHVKGPKGSRVVKAHDFFQGLFTVDLAADEIIVGVQFTPVKAAAYAKLYQRASHFAIVGVAAALDVSNGTIQSARIGLTGASSHATRLTDVEEALAGKPLSADEHRGRRAARGRQAGGHQLRHPCQRGVSARDGSGLHRTRVGARDGARRLIDVPGATAAAGDGAIADGRRFLVVK